MKDIRIFVASSKELLPERNALAYFVLAHEDEFAKRGLRVRLSKWEYVDPTMTEERTEDRYLDEMLNCDAVLMLFRHVLGKYTKEEVDKAIAAEVAGTSRIKKHLILFKEGDADESPELAAWRASLADGTYGTFTDAGGLGAHFLRLVEQIAGLPLLDVADAESEKTISAFLAVDDELAVDRDAFADAVLNLNDVLSHRGARVRLRFYDPEQHRDILDNSEMALVLYQTKCGAFGTSALKESYDRAKEEKNPKRLYVFFRDAAGKPLDADFQTFKDGFAEAFGSSPCRFENVDTLSLNFLFALESVLGDGAGTFVRLDGRTVVADGLEVGNLTKLPMLERNSGLKGLFSRMEDVSKRFVAQREKCDKNPQDDGLYVELLDLSAEKNRLQDQIDRELKMSFNLAKRLAAISIAQVNETIARARAKVEEGDIKGALEILDGASSALKRRRLLHKAADRAEAEELQIKELKASAEIENFRVDAVMAYTAMPFEERFKKAEGILSSLVSDCESFFNKCVIKHRAQARHLLADSQEQLANLRGDCGDSQGAEVAWGQAIANYRELAQTQPDAFITRVALALNSVGLLRVEGGSFDEAEKNLEEAFDIFSARSELGKFARLTVLLLHNLAYLSQERGEFAEAEVLETASLEYAKQMAHDGQEGYDELIASIVYGLACLHTKTGALDESDREFAMALETYRRLANKDSFRCGHQISRILSHQADRIVASFPTNEEVLEAERKYAEVLGLLRLLADRNPVAYGADLVESLHGLASLHMHSRRLSDAEKEFKEADELKRRLGLRNLYKRRTSGQSLLSQQDFEDEDDEFDFELHESDVQQKIKRRERLQKIHRWLAELDPGKYGDGLALAQRSLDLAH